jgi:hypothetical protein
LLTSLEKLKFSRFICNGDITEQFSFCRPLPQATKGQDFVDVDSYLSFYDLLWKLCMDGAPFMSGNLKGSVTLAKQENP